EGGAIVGAVAVVQDVGPQKRAEAELARHRDRLQELVEERTARLEESLRRLGENERLAAIGTLAAGVGHDIGNLALPIRARIASLASERMSDEARQDVEAIDEALSHLSDLSAGLRLMA